MSPSIFDAIGRTVAITCLSLAFLVAATFFFSFVQKLIGFPTDPDFSVGLWTGIFFMWINRKLSA